jgi:uncharacterized protein YecE (DUF72 family)
MPALRFGTCSWSEKSWVGPFYPRGTKPAEYLGHYARQFDSVEVDSTYYACPPRERFERWAKDTPEGFVLSSKLPCASFLGEDARELDAGRVLHIEEFRPAIETYYAALAGLGSKAGPVVLQLPWMRPGIFRDVGEFLGRLDPFLAALPATPRIAVEVRNREYVHEELLAVLRKHRAALVLSEVRGMPHPADVAEKHAVSTTDFFYARLIGDRSAVERRTKTFDRIVLDQAASLGRWAHLLRTLASSADGFVYANNHFAGHGPETARELRRLVEPAAEPPPT